MDADYAQKATLEVCLCGGITCAGPCVVFYLFSRCLERVTNREFEINRIRSAEQQADFLLKPLHAETFRFDRDFIMNVWWFHSSVHFRGYFGV